MSTTIPNFITTKSISNLDTYVYTVNTAAMHVAKITINEVPASGLSILIKQNSSTIATSTAPASGQSVINLSATMNCSVNDTISFVVSSSTAIDQGPNAFKGIINIHIGSLN